MSASESAEQANKRITLNYHRRLPQIKAAAEIWDLIQNASYPADRFLGNFFHQHRKKFGSHDRRFISEVIYSLFRNKLFYQAWAMHLGERSSEFWVLMAAGLEGFIPEDEWPAFRAPLSLEKIKTFSFPPGMSRKDLGIRYSCPDWLLQKWTHQFGEEETQALLESIQNRPPFVIRTNTIRISRDQLVERLLKRKYEISKTERSTTGILFKDRTNLFDSEEFREGLFEVQDEGSQWICEVIAPKPGEILWDVCAGAGGKSLAFAALMQNKGRIIATDIRQKKMDDLRKRATRAGVSTIFPADLERMGEIKAIRNGVDKVVVDAPCSGTGTLRRNPDAKWKLKENVFAGFHSEQVAIVEKSLPHLKPGGRLFYITCSLEPEENEEVMREVLQNHPELKVIPCSESGDGFLRLRPHLHKTDGFFLAIAEKTK